MNLTVYSPYKHLHVSIHTIIAAIFSISVALFVIMVAILLMVAGIWLSALSSVVVGSSPIYNVADFGAFGNGIMDDTQAFMKAWAAACADHNRPTFLIPSGGGRTFLLTQTTFWGPCKSNIHVQISGNLVAPHWFWTSRAETWIIFINIHGLTVDGHGQLDGQGAIWWPYRLKGLISAAPYIIEFIHCNNLQLSGIYLKNSPDKHVAIYHCKWVKVFGLTIQSPGDSPNTDGILIADSNHVDIQSSTIGVGDDCIAVGTGCHGVNVSQVTCGPGHGISVGSLGPNSQVEKVRITDCTIFQATTGVRIKTKQGGSGYARHIVFKNIEFNSVKTPIVIDQFYCPQGNCPNKTSAVAISDVIYKHLYGTSVEPMAIRLACSESQGCKRLTFKNISFTVEGSNVVPTQSYCFNAFGILAESCFPKLQCF